MNKKQLYLAAFIDHEECNVDLFLTSSEEIASQILKDIMPTVFDDHEETEELIEMANDKTLTIKDYQDYIDDRDLRINLNVYLVNVFTSENSFEDLNSFIISEKSLNIENEKNFDDEKTLYYLVTDNSNDSLRDYLSKKYNGCSIGRTHLLEQSSLEMICILPDAKKIEYYKCETLQEITEERDRKNYFKEYRVQLIEVGVYDDDDEDDIDDDNDVCDKCKKCNSSEG
jgi:hypothetical protein